MRELYVHTNRFARGIETLNTQTTDFPAQDARNVITPPTSDMTTELCPKYRASWLLLVVERMFVAQNVAWQCDVRHGKPKPVCQGQLSWNPTRQRSAKRQAVHPAAIDSR